MNGKITALLTCLALLIAAGCSKKPKQELTNTGTEKPAATDSAKTAQAHLDSLKNASLMADSMEAARLEKQRAALEDMMNKLVSSEVYFAFNKAVLTDTAKTLLGQCGDILQKEPKLTVVVEGNTDERGSEAYNMALGGQRAQSVVQYLINYGVSTSRMKSLSNGEEKPQAQGHDEAAWAKNRRAAFSVQITK
jgi:peptidoglycan-associated lipoprotein